MQHFVDFYREHWHCSESPWLILGKGQSFSKRYQFNTSKFNLISLNHVVRELPVLVAHAIDIEVVEQSAEAIEQNAQFLVMPWIPHVGMKLGELDLSEWLSLNPTLAKLDRQKRLLWYDLNSANRRNGSYSVVDAQYFSAEAALNLLAISGARTVRSLGIDGGTGYSEEFADLWESTRLANGQPSYDLQFKEFGKTLIRFEMDYAPLDEEAPIRVFVGGNKAEWLPFKVLEYSIRKNASMSVNCYQLCEIENLSFKQLFPLKNTRQVANCRTHVTPMSSDYSTRSIYLQSNMLVMKDISSLWRLPFEDSQILTVSPDGASQDEKSALPKISPEWNCLDQYDPNGTALIHYRDLNKQPWLNRNHPYAYLWMAHLREALNLGFIGADAINEQVRQGNVRPSLIYQIEHELDNPWLIDDQGVRLDVDFFSLMHKQEQFTLSTLLGWLKNCRKLEELKMAK